MRLGKTKIIEVILLLALSIAPRNSFSESSPEHGKLINYMAAHAKKIGGSIEKLGEDAQVRIMGQWYLEGLEPDCIDGFFYEFRENGVAISQFGDKGSYKFNETYIEVTTKVADVEGYTESPTAIFQINGMFYIPSYECGLAKLVRGPALKITDGFHSTFAKTCKVDQDCVPTKQKGCLFRDDFPELQDPKNSEVSCKCLKGSVYFGCVVKGSEWDRN